MLTDTDRTVIADRFTRHLPSTIKYDEKTLTLRINEIERKVLNWWTMSNSDATTWLALGLDLLTGTGFAHITRRPGMTGSQGRLHLVDSVIPVLTEHEWSDQDITLAKAWLDVSPYTLWQMVEDARQAGYSEVENILLDAVRKDASGESVAQAIKDSFQKAVQKWAAHP